MRLLTDKTRAVALITIAVSVIGLIMSPVSAAGIFSPSGDPAAPGTHTGTAAYHHTFNSTQQTARLQAVLANLSQQGVDVSEARADLAAPELKEGMTKLLHIHPSLPKNSPQRQ